MGQFILYHADCPDGFGAAFAAWLKLADTAQYIPCRYGDPPPDLPPDAEVTLVDFSFKRPVLEQLAAEVKQIQVIDHHKTAQADLDGLSYAHFDMNKSGAVLAWEHFHPGTEVPLFLLYVQDRDLWKFELPESLEVNAAIYSHPRDFIVWGQLLYQTGHLRVEGRAIRRLQIQQIASNVQHAGVVVINSYLVPVVNTNHEISETCNELCKQYPQYPFAAAYFDLPDGKRKWSLRSIGDFDVSIVAKQFGGGGHKNAAGYEEGADRFVRFMGRLGPVEAQAQNV